MLTKKFKHAFIAVKQLKQLNLEEGRRYDVGDGRQYPSITTVLSKTKDNTFLFEWRKRVGADKAQQITTSASKRGTKMHTLCEKYLLNEDVNDLGYSTGELLFRSIKPSLDRLDNIKALETGLYSHRLGVAGTVDCIAEVDGVLTIIDFKTSTKEKNKEWIEDYFLQGAFYFNAFYEITGDLPKQILILIALENGGVQEFMLKGKEIIEATKELEKRIGMYNAIN